MLENRIGQRGRTMLMRSVMALVLLGVMGTIAAASLAATSADAKRVIGMVTAVQHPYYAATAVEAKKTAKALGYTLVFVQPNACDAQVESQIIRDVATRGIDALAVSACDAAGVLPTVKDVLSQKKVPLVTFDADCCNAMRSIAISNSDAQIGVLGGQAVNQLLPQGGEILTIVGALSQQNVQARLKTLKTTLRKNIKLTVVTDKNDTAATPQIVRDSLTRNPEIDLILTQTGSAGAVAATLKQLKSEIPLVGLNAFPDVLTLMKKGQITSTIALNSGLQGELAIRSLDLLLKGKKPTVKFFGTSGLVITQQNLNTWQKDLAKKNVALRAQFLKLWK